MFETFKYSGMKIKYSIWKNRNNNSNKLNLYLLLVYNLGSDVLYVRPIHNEKFGIIHKRTRNKNFQ